MDDRTRDELAGVVDLFGGLTRDELADALLELAFKRGQEVDEDAVDAAIADAVHDYYLVEVEAQDACVLAPGPAAFPTLPENGEDLPHLLDAPRRSLDRDALGDAVTARLETEATDADPERARSLLDVTYDAEAWASIDLSDVRETLDAAVDGVS